MGKDIGQIYKHSQSQLSTLSIKESISSSSASQTSSSIELTTTSVTSVDEKKQNNYALCYQHSIHKYVSITNNNNIKSCGTERKNLAFQPLQLLIIMNKVLLPHPQVCQIYTQPQDYLWLVKNISSFRTMVKLPRSPGVLNQG